MTIDAKLIEFHKIFKGAPKTGVNPRFQTKYATLDDLVQATAKPLASVGLYIRHEIEPDGDRFYVVTGVYDSDELCVTSRFPINLDVNPQVIGSQLTYAKRYNIACLLNIGEQEDDDGNAVAVEAEKRQQRHDTKPKPKPATDQQVALIRDYCDAGSVPTATKEWLEKHDFLLTYAQAKKLITSLKAEENV